MTEARMTGSAARVILVDDSIEYRSGVQMGLSEFSDEVQIVGEAGDLEQAEELIDGLRPDVVLLDLQLPERRWSKPAVEHGLAVLNFIHRLPKPPRVLVLSLFREGAEDLFKAFRAGADGCVYKEDVNADELVTAIHKLSAGQAVYTSTIAELMRSEFLKAHVARGRDGGLLSSSEDDVLRDLEEGKTVEEIDENRALRPGTAGAVANSLLERLRAIAARDEAGVNPFTYGNPISEPDRFFGRTREVDHIFSRLRNREFESSSIVGERRIGKTSLLMYIEHPEVRRAYGMGDQYMFAHIDLQMLEDEVTPHRFWTWLLGQLARRCRDQVTRELFEHAQTAEGLDNFALLDLFGTIDERGQYVVLLLDEFERITANEAFTHDFFLTLRSLAIHHNLALVTASRSELIDLCHADIRTSPFFNIFANLNLRLMEEDEAIEMLSRPLVDTRVTFSDIERQQVLLQAGSHPYFLQAAAHFLYEAYQRGLPPAERLVFMATEFRREAWPHYREFWTASDDGERITLAALALLDQREGASGRRFETERVRSLYRGSEQALTRLHDRGLVTSDRGQFALQSTTFSDWIRSELAADRDEESYDDWVASNKPVLERLSSQARREMSRVLPRVSGNYRELVVQWASDPRNLMALLNLLKTTVGLQ
jgi:DNA-binding NarL/FixJ family response regulator